MRRAIHSRRDVPWTGIACFDEKHVAGMQLTLGENQCRMNDSCILVVPVHHPSRPRSSRIPNQIRRLLLRIPRVAILLLPRPSSSSEESRRRRKRRGSRRSNGRSRDKRSSRSSRRKRHRKDAAARVAKAVAVAVRVIQAASLPSSVRILRQEACSKRKCR